MSDHKTIRHLNAVRGYWLDKPAALSLRVCPKICLAMLVWVAIVSPARAQKVPENGEKLAIGTDVMAPCACKGNLCALWPPPASGTFPRGFTTTQTKITSFISRGVTIEGHWEGDKGVGGAAVTEPSKGGRCVKVNGGGVLTEEPAPAIFSMTSPGTYRLSIVTFEWKAIYDCRQADCSFSNPHVLQSEMGTEERFFTVVAHPGTGCNNESMMPISEVTECRADNCEAKLLTDQERLSMGLGAPMFFRGQTVRIPPDKQAVQVKFEDGSIMRMIGGTSMKISTCEELVDKSPSFEGTLLLGKIWHEVVKAVGGPDQNLGFTNINSPYHGTGVRGTTYSVAYDPATRTTTVEVEEGTVWMRNIFGVPVTLVLTAGQTGIGVGNEPPTLRK